MDLDRLASLSPVRSAEDILSGRVRLSVGGTFYDVPALPIRKNRLWKESLDAQVAALIGAVDASSADLPAVLALLASASDQLLDLLIAYDDTHALPPREELEEVMTEAELLTAVMEVWAAANPLVGIGLQTLGAPPTPVPLTSVSSPPTSSRRRNTAGPRTSSKAS